MLTYLVDILAELGYETVQLSVRAWVHNGKGNDSINLVSAWTRECFNQYGELIKIGCALMHAKTRTH